MDTSTHLFSYIEQNYTLNYYCCFLWEMAYEKNNNEKNLLLVKVKFSMNH